jgi:hypothetical protein
MHARKTPQATAAKLIFGLALSDLAWITKAEA